MNALQSLADSCALWANGDRDQVQYQSETGRSKTGANLAPQGKGKGNNKNRLLPTKEAEIEDCKADILEKVTNKQVHKLYEMLMFDKRMRSILESEINS